MSSDDPRSQIPARPDAKHPDGAAARESGPRWAWSIVPPATAPEDSDLEWDSSRDPMEGIDPATTWWGG